MKQCRSEGCSNQVVQGNVCWRHVENNNKTTQAQAHGKGGVMVLCSTVLTRNGDDDAIPPGRGEAASTTTTSSEREEVAAALVHMVTTVELLGDSLRRQQTLGLVGEPTLHLSKKRKRKECSADGCNNISNKGGVCIRHGAKIQRKKCSSPGCVNIAQKGGKCKRHNTTKVDRVGAPKREREALAEDDEVEVVMPKRIAQMSERSSVASGSSANEVSGLDILIRAADTMMKKQSTKKSTVSIPPPPSYPPPGYLLHRHEWRKILQRGRCNHPCAMTKML